MAQKSQKQQFWFVKIDVKTLSPDKNCVAIAQQLVLKILKLKG